MASNFLNELKNAVDKGEFNSNLANKINTLAEKASDVNLMEVKEKVEAIKLEPVDAETAQLANIEYDNRMNDLLRHDITNKAIANLIDIEETIELSIGDMIEYCNEIKSEYSKEFESKNVIFNDLSTRIDSIISKYSSFINK